MKYDLSILIPANNEEFLSRTVESILETIEGNTEIIVVLDGLWSNPPLPQHERLTVLYNPVSVGQRAATNQAARLSQAKYVIKTDAHCIFDKGFDVKLMQDMQDDYTMVPTMRNLHAFDWVCKKCGNRWYQSPTPTNCFKDYSAKEPNETCDSTEFERDIVWRAKPSPNNNFYRFDSTLHFQYWKDFEKRPEGQGDLCETMSIQGSFFMLTREKYFELDICEEAHGSWGQQGVEVACKTWLSGGKVITSRKTWYAHLFRTQGGDFSFPYANPGSAQEKAREYSRWLWFGNNWPLAKRPLRWLLEKFAPVPDWDNMEEVLRIEGEKYENDESRFFESVKMEKTKGILYYTDNRIDERIMIACQNQMKKAGLPIVSVSLEPIDFGENIVMPLERGYLTMAKQILTGLKAMTTDYVFFCEHDVLYHLSHFEFTPPRNDAYYYNENTWKVRADDGHAVHYLCKQLSGLCAERKFLIRHFEERVRRIESEGFSRKMGFEPGTHNRPERIDDFKAVSWMSPLPNIDIRHDKNLTASRWSPSEFRDQRNCKNWTEADEIAGWGVVKGCFFESILRPLLVK